MNTALSSCSTCLLHHQARLKADHPEETVDVKRLAKGRAAIPRWRLVPTTDDKFVVNLGATGMVHAKDQIKSLAARRLGLDSADANFPEIVQSDFDGAVSGKTFLDDVCESNQGVHQVVDPSDRRPARNLPQARRNNPLPSDNRRGRHKVPTRLLPRQHSRQLLGNRPGWHRRPVHRLH